MVVRAGIAVGVIGAADAGAGDHARPPGSVRPGLESGTAGRIVPGLTVIRAGEPNALPDRGTGRDAAAAGSIWDTVTATRMFVGERRGIGAGRVERGAAASGICGRAPLAIAAGDQRRSGFQNHRPDD